MLRLRLVHGCGERWDRMTEVEGGRHCASCDKRVLDLTSATEDEARARLSAASGPTACVRMNLDVRGRPLFVAAAAAMAAAVAACGGSAPPPAHEPPSIALPAPESRSALEPAVAETDGPDADDDGDGVPNSVDACPKEPGAASDGSSRPAGCPFVGIVVTTETPQLVAEVAFPRGSTTVPHVADPMLHDVAEALRAHPDLTPVEVQGHASGDEPNAQKVSEARARAVVARLVASGIDPSRLVARGLGSTLPKATSYTEEGRAQNRRVSFHIGGDASP